MTDCHHCQRAALTYEDSAWHPSGGIVARFRCRFCDRLTTIILTAKEVAERVAAGALIPDGLASA